MHSALSGAGDLRVNGRPGVLTVVGRPEGKRVRLESPRSWGFSKAASVCTPILRMASMSLGMASIPPKTLACPLRLRQGPGVRRGNAAGSPGVHEAQSPSSRAVARPRSPVSPALFCVNSQ